MFTIVISEKGGAERRETFEKNEINVGRVQGNDLLLPKGNVSKHHARLLYRDGRFIVTDLKSTNGTYVNGRKISQATIVREGDKIYVGDFVLRVETLQKIAAQSEDDGPPRASSSSRDGAQGGPAMAAARPPLPPPLPAGVAHHSGPAAGGVAMIAPPISSSAPRLSEPGVSHYPLERDPDDSESSPDLPAGRAPKSQSPLRLSEQPGSRTGVSTMSAGGERAGSMRDASPPSGAPARVGRSVPPPRPAPRETPQQAAHRLALITLVDRVGDVLDLAPLDQSPWVAIELSQAIDRALREQATAMRDEGEAPDGIDLD
ncbi:MAG: FHA domain-containing protein, partial [Myxococcota bacterium]|nr:FHA domain-containing protein [Myxococcota bacterium]